MATQENVTQPPKKKSAESAKNLSSEKLLTVLEVMSRLQAPARLQEVARLCGLNPSTALRFLNTLQKRDYVAQEIDTGRYYITFKLCALAQDVSTYSDLRSIALPFMRQVAAACTESCNLAVESDLNILYIEVANGPSKTLFSTQRIGNIAPMHCTGVGKLFLSEFYSHEFEKYMALKKLTRYTPHTITDIAALKEELSRIQALGYALDNEECELGVRCVAAPIRDYTGRISAGISISGPSTRMGDDAIQSCLPLLLQTAGELSTRMGWQKDRG